MAFWLSWPKAEFSFGHVTIRIPSELKLDWTLSESQFGGKVHFRENCLITLDAKAPSSSLVSVKENSLVKLDRFHTIWSNGAFASSVMRQFSRKWTLPPSCDSDKVQSNLSSDGDVSKIKFSLGPWKPKGWIFFRTRHHQNSIWAQIGLNFVWITAWWQGPF